MVNDTKSVSNLFDEALKFHGLGKLKEAETLYTTILHTNPEHALSRKNLAALLVQNRSFEDAKDALEGLMRDYPEDEKLHINLALCHKGMGNFKDAQTHLQRALELNPNSISGHFNYANLLRDSREFSQALHRYDKVISLQAGHEGALINKGNTLLALERHIEALEHFNQVIHLFPEHIGAHLNRGNVYKSLKRYSDALKDYELVLLKNPKQHEALNNIGTIYLAQNKVEDSIHYFRQSINTAPNFAQGHCNLASALLLTENFSEGWAHYEWRWRNSNFPSKYLPSNKPTWTPKSDPEASVLVWAEQGLGDEIMFGLNLQKLASKCSNILLQVDPRLTKLYQRSFPRIQVYSKENFIPEENYSHQISMGSLCQHFIVDTQSIHPNPYLIPATEKIKDNSSNKARIGISWKSNNKFTGQDRSIELTEFISHLKYLDAEFINIQYGDTESERINVENIFNVKVHDLGMDNQNDIDGLATIIASCEYILTIDNSTAHLAGALGKKTFVLLPFTPDWRWLLNKDKSYLYEKINLIRQDRPGKWDSALIALGEQLKNSITKISNKEIF